MSKAQQIVDALGGADNIEDVEGCITRLRCELKDGSRADEAALKAALNPADGPWLYFVAVNPVSGETKFATEWAEHERNVAEWQAFCKSHQGSC